MLLSPDVGLLVALLLGIAANFVGQVLLCRIFRRGLLTGIAGGFSAGGAVTAAYASQALSQLSLSLLDTGGIFATVFIIYGAAGVLLFSVANLGETSLRIRLLHLLSQDPKGLSTVEIRKHYDDDRLSDTRFERMVAHNLVRVTEGVVYPRLSILLLAFGAIWVWKWLLYGRRTRPLP